MFLLENAGEAVTSTTVSAVADVFPKSGIENLAADASFGEKLAYALKYAAIGLMTVFMVLIIIMAVLYLFKLFSVFGSKKKATATTAPAPKAAEAPAGDSEEELVAVATAAIVAELIFFHPNSYFFKKQGPLQSITQLHKICSSPDMPLL